MNNRSNLGLSQGFMQGFNFMEGIEDRHQMRRLREDQNFRQKETHGLIMKRGERAEKEFQRQDDARLVQAMNEGVRNGNIDPKIANEFSQRFDVDWTNYVDPEFGQSLQVLEGAVQGKVKMQSPEFRSAFGRVFRKEINKNVGEKTKDGATIAEKRLRGVYPAPDGQGIMVDLDVLEQTKDGERWRSAPVTDNRSAADENVKLIPLEKALEKLQGHKIVFDAVQNTPQLKAMLSQYAARSGVSLPKNTKFGGVQNHPELGYGQFDANGRFHQLSKDDSNNPLVINNQLVSPDGKSLGDFRNEKDKNPQVKGVVVDNELRNPYTGELIGDASSSKGGLESSTKSQIQQTAKSFHGTFNPDGTFIGIPEGARDSYVEAMHRTEVLLSQGVSLYKAMKIANLSTLEKMGPEEAEEIAERIADENDLDDEAKEAFIRRHSRELLNEKNKAHELYEQLSSGKGESQGLNLPKESPQPLDKSTPQANMSGKIIRTPKPVKEAPSEAVDYLLSNVAQKPELKDQFFEHYGYLPEGV